MAWGQSVTLDSEWDTTKERIDALTDGFATGITAFSGGGQASATSITNQVSIVTVIAADADSVKLPLLSTLSNGQQFLIKNRDAAGNNLLDVFPATGDALGDLADNVAQAIRPGKDILLTVVDGIAWDISFDNSVTDATLDPSATDDIDEGFVVGNTWYNTSNDISWTILDTTDGAAVWKATSNEDDTSVYVNVGAMIPRTTNGPATATSELPTNDIMVDTLDYDAVTEEGAGFWWTPPPNWDSGTVTLDFHWTGVAGSGGVTWGAAARSYANDEALDQALPASVDTDDTFIAADDVHIVTSAAVTISGATVGEPVYFEITRVVGDANDTKAEDAKLLGVVINYNL